jgi:hypothetical protein
MRRKVITKIKNRQIYFVLRQDIIPHQLIHGLA